MVKEGGSGSLPDPEWTQDVLEQIENLLLIIMPVCAAGIMDYLCQVGSFHNRYEVTEKKLLVEHDSYPSANTKSTSL